MPPNSSTTRSTASSTDSASRMSPTIGSACPPASRMSSAAVWIVPGSLGCGSSVLAISATLAPSSAARSAIASPTPRLPPEMNIVLPSQGAEALSVATQLLLPYHESMEFCLDSLLPPRSNPIGELFPQLALEDFAGGVARQVLHEEDVFGALVVRQLLFGVFFQLLAQVFHFGAFLGNDHGANGFDPLLIRKSYDRDLGDRLVFEEGIFRVAT